MFSVIAVKKVGEHWSHSKGRKIGDLLSVLVPAAWALEWEILVEAEALWWVWAAAEQPADPWHTGSHRNWWHYYWRQQGNLGFARMNLVFTKTFVYSNVCCWIRAEVKVQWHLELTCLWLQASFEAPWYTCISEQYSAFWLRVGSTIGLLCS